MPRYIYQIEKWPHFEWDDTALQPLLHEIAGLQGRLLGKMEMVGFELKTEASLETITQDVIKSSEIEGEILNTQQVRSSVAIRLGVDISGLVPSERHIDGVVEMMLDATQHFNQPMSKERLFGWQSLLFPTGRSGMYIIETGRWRTDSNGPMQVISGGYGKKKIHFEAPDAPALENEMGQFIEWLNSGSLNENYILKAAVAHLWFITLHPFEDGNGRIARAITDMLLARADGIPQRFYSMSTQIQKQRNYYYDILETTQKGPLDITAWIKWFLECLQKSLIASTEVLDKIIFKHNFWANNAAKIENPRQRLMLEKLLTDFEGNLTAAKWAKMTKISPDTALRDINSLIAANILKKSDAGGRSTSYELA
ncbi:cell filamentation protein Fic [Flavobacterium akiainvivens]|uniref:Cell filamentation protein Fic n=1 Tax=Flavobacterium akiainvivens TaxID=1202724 RepID=A0A0M9VIT0_9FLAO|nr:Fic family protein [Flavobacterium akiainvivens]KOS06962.1 cell filamentation protein Fic [Flavobacterium akiainvivens]SFQ59961.1 Fic family protein [Flavobacterium akiainvivens]